MTERNIMKNMNFKSITILLMMGTIAMAEEINLYEIEAPVDSRTISFENPTGEKGKGGMAASKIGVGRKRCLSRRRADDSGERKKGKLNMGKLIRSSRMRPSNFF